MYGGGTTSNMMYVHDCVLASGNGRIRATVFQRQGRPLRGTGGNLERQAFQGGCLSNGCGAMPWLDGTGACAAESAHFVGNKQCVCRDAMHTCTGMSMGRKLRPRSPLPNSEKSTRRPDIVLYIHATRTSGLRTNYGIILLVAHVYSVPL